MALCGEKYWLEWRVCQGKLWGVGWGFDGINGMKVGSEEESKGCWLEGIGNWNKELV